MEEHLPEAEAAMLATSHLSDARCYDLVWASGIVTRAWQNLQSAFVAEGRAEWLEELRPFVAGGSITPPNQEEAAARLGVPIATLRTWLSRLRQRYRESLRMEVANTVSDPADVDAELRHLYQILVAGVDVTHGRRKHGSRNNGASSCGDLRDRWPAAGAM